MVKSINSIKTIQIIINLIDSGLNLIQVVVISLLSAIIISGQNFDYYGPKPFGEILEQSFNKPWTPQALASIANRDYVVILDQATKSMAVMLDATDNSTLNMVSIEAINGASSTYGSVMRSIFQLVDINTHLDNNIIPLSGEYRINPMLHSYFGINSSTDNIALCSDGGTRYISDAASTGYVLVQFEGSAESVKIKAVSKWVYDAITDSIVEVAGWQQKWLAINGNGLKWSEAETEASVFCLADANDLIDFSVNDGSDFNPLNVPFQPNATASLPEIKTIDESQVLTDILREVDVKYQSQFGTSESAASAAAATLDVIETTLINNGESLRYPKEFYLALRRNMTSHIIASTDIYGAKPGYNTVPHVYFTNAADDNGEPHPFMVIASHAVSARPNLLIDVHRPPGAIQGVGYSEIPVTRHGKPGEFLIKIPLKDYGLIENLLDNDLTPYGGDLASDFDISHGTTTEKTVYNYAALASIGVAVDGVTIYPAFNNNIRFAVEDAEITGSGIHVGGGLELHYHADGHGYNGNGINLYNIADYETHDHPPVIGIAYDGIALFGKYETAYSAMAGFNIPLDEFGGHDHGQGFGYHYHAHPETVTSGDPLGTTFTENFLLEGAWKGKINGIPGFSEGKFNQFRDPAIARYAGASYTAVSTETETGIPEKFVVGQNYPNPFNPSTTIEYFIPGEANVNISIYNLLGELKEQFVFENQEAGFYSVRWNAENYPSGMYIYRATARYGNFTGKPVSGKMLLIK